MSSGPTKSLKKAQLYTHGSIPCYPFCWCFFIPCSSNYTVLPHPTPLKHSNQELSVNSMLLPMLASDVWACQQPRSHQGPKLQVVTPLHTTWHQRPLSGSSIISLLSNPQSHITSPDLYLKALTNCLRDWLQSHHNLATKYAIRTIGALLLITAPQQYLQRLQTPGIS